MTLATSPARSADAAFEVMGTTAHIVVVGGDPTALAGRTEARLRDLERRWSRFLPDSEISRLNAAGGRPCVVSSETYDLVARAVAAWEHTGGRFDPTVLPALRAAGYDRTFAEITSPTARHGSDLPSPGCARIAMIPSARLVQLPRGTEIDLGGIGKGFAADVVAAEMRAAGALGACVNLGGDLRVFGPSPRGGAWSIDVADPFSSAHPLTRLGVTDGAVATSSRLGRVWAAVDGARHHLVDPHTGSPANTGLAAVTVVAADAWRAEVLAKWAFLAGARDGAALIAAEGAAGLLVDDAGARTGAGPIEEFLA